MPTLKSRMRRRRAEVDMVVSVARNRHVSRKRTENEIYFSGRVRRKRLEGVEIGCRGQRVGFKGPCARNSAAGEVRNDSAGRGGGQKIKSLLRCTGRPSSKEMAALVPCSHARCISIFREQVSWHCNQSMSLVLCTWLYDVENGRHLDHPVAQARVF